MVSIKLASRFFPKIEKEIEAGNRRFYLYGPMVKDEFFYNSTRSLTNLTDSIVYRLFRSNRGVEKVVVIDSDGANLYTPTGTLFECQRASSAAAVRDFLIDERKEASDPLDNRAAKKPIAKSKDSQQPSTPYNKGADAVASSTDNLNFMIASLNSLAQAGHDITTNFAIIFNRFDWSTKLFDKQQHDFDLLKLALWFGSDSSFTNPPYCFYILDKINALKEYVVTLDEGDTAMYIGLPSKKELESALFNQFEDVLQTADVIKRIAKVSRSAKQSLRSTLNTIQELINTNDIQVDRLEELYRARIGYSLQDLTWKNIHLKPHVKTQLLNYFKSHKQESSTSKSLGLILYGPPGTGKTTIAKVLANVEDRALVTAKLADLKAGYVGQTAHLVKDLFDRVRAASPALLFLDEIETIFPARKSNSSDSFTDDLVTQFLAESDGVFSEASDFIILGATNIIESVDPAVVSRLAPVAIDLPDDPQRRKILKSGLSDYWDSLTNQNKKDLVNRTQGCSGRELRDLLIEKIIQFIANNDDEEACAAVDYALAQLKESIGKTLQQGGTGFILRNFNDDDPGLDAIIGHKKIKENLISEITTLLEPSAIKSIGLLPENGFLLYGPPGNGKTFFANTIAHHFSLDMVEVNLSNILQGDRDIVSNLNDIFDRACRYSILSTNGIVLFFDEFDSLAAKGQQQWRDTFLKRIEALRKNYPKILLMAATNFYSSIDDAIIRAGRFDAHLEINNPKPSEIPLIFRQSLNSFFTLDEGITDLVLSDIFSHASSEFTDKLSFKKVGVLADKVSRKVFNSPDSICSNNKYIITELNIRNVLDEIIRR